MRWASSEIPPSAGVYLHVPFCSVRCAYCDFATVAGRDASVDAYLDALVREILTREDGVPGPVDTIFLGGGTPSRLEPLQVARLLDAVRSRFEVARDAEITIEGNPESLTAERLEGYRQATVNRVSVGVQSLDDRVLRRAGRPHDSREAIRAVARARAAGVPTVSVDLIAGLPGEDLARWRETVDRVASLGPDHVSVYLLETDKDTPLGRSVRAGRTAVADDDRMADVYLETVDALEARGFALYEISNFARGAKVSRHNLKYWTDAPYAGFGLGAHGYVAGVRRANRRDLDGYLADLAAGRDPVAWVDPWSPERRLEEALFLGLRLASGVDLREIGDRYGADPEIRWRDAWRRAEEAGIVARDGSRVRLTPAGRVRSNELFAELV